jgi:hypothetical protein
MTEKAKGLAGQRAKDKGGRVRRKKRSEGRFGLVEGRMA